MKKVYLENLSLDQNKTEIIKSFIENEKLEVEFAYKSDFGLTRILRDFVEVSGNIFSFPELILSKIILVCDELNNNAIGHGSDKKGLNYMRLNIFKNENKIFLNIEVEDNGKGKEAKTALEMETLRAHQLKKGYNGHKSIRGRGLFLIIVQIVDRLYFKNSKKGGLIVGIKKEIQI